MWIKSNPLSGLIFVIYPQEMLVSAKKKPWMIEIFSICWHPPIPSCNKINIFGDSFKQEPHYCANGAWK